jgi:hypothetical protein
MYTSHFSKIEKIPLIIHLVYWRSLTPCIQQRNSLEYYQDNAEFHTVRAWQVNPLWLIHKQQDRKSQQFVINRLFLASYQLWSGRYGTECQHPFFQWILVTGIFFKPLGYQPIQRYISYSQGYEMLPDENQGLLMVELEIPTIVVMKSSIFWYIMPRSLWRVNWPFRGICHLCLHDGRVSNTRNNHEAGS